MPTISSVHKELLLFASNLQNRSHLYREIRVLAAVITTQLMLALYYGLSLYLAVWFRVGAWFTVHLHQYTTKVPLTEYPRTAKAQILP